MCIDLIKRNACWEIIRVIIGTDPGTYPGIQVYQKLKKGAEIIHWKGNDCILTKFRH